MTYCRFTPSASDRINANVLSNTPTIFREYTPYKPPVFLIQTP